MYRAPGATFTSALPLFPQALLLTAYEKMLVAEPDNAVLREAVDALLAR